MTIDRESLWMKSISFHGHKCPGLAIGVRIALDFLELGYSHAEDEELATICETDACGVDGIQVILGCTIGKGNLFVRKRGKQVFTIYQRNTGTGRRYYWKGHGREDKNREERIDYFLNGPSEELYTVESAGHPLPPMAKIYKSGYCSICGERAAEPHLRIMDGKTLCLDCAGYKLDLSTQTD